MPEKNSFIEKIIPKYIPNIIVLASFSVIAFFTGPVKKRIRDAHYEENKNTISDFSGELFKEGRHIENQTEWGRVRFGTHKKSNMSYSGCEIIATYNALQSLGDKGTTMPYLIRYFEQKGIALKGGFGISPSAPFNFFRSRGYDVQRTTTRNKETLKKLGDLYRTFLVTFYWNSENIKDQLHTVNISKESDGFYIHNNYCRDKNGVYKRQGRYENLAEAIENLGEKTVPMVVIAIRNGSENYEKY